MNRNSITQKEAIFYLLYTRFKEGNGEYLPVHQLMGEIWCEEVGRWGYVSYECSARASQMWRQNPNLIQRTKLRGRSGATFFGYRINPDVSREDIKDEKLRAFHSIIKSKRKP